MFKKQLIKFFLTLISHPAARGGVIRKSTFKGVELTMSIEKLIADLTTALRENTAATTQLNEGRNDALQQLKAAATSDADKPARKRRTSAEVAADAAAEQAPQADTAADAQSAKDEGAQARQGDFSGDALKSIAATYLGKFTDPAVRTPEAQKIKAMLDYFGTPALSGEKSTLDDDQRYQAHWFLTRIVNGLAVNYSADNDFDSDPLGDAKGGDSDDDMLG